MNPTDNDIILLKTVIVAVIVVPVVVANKSIGSEI